ncbi:hypothetical protein K6Q96_09045 [Grimontia kaedaensis]|uniref:Lipoprotein n=1 Tax=Grimontia kaedaensis TaxID=2872157 RepID=A0ABY4WVK4_9GAMM|nr:hypothetical protein [Grimontia kaedaensis]USH01087.1 hypothetical protein K6Q96_09045 [Grimontia kaedaensis]
MAKVFIFLFAMIPLSALCKTVPLLESSVTENGTTRTYILEAPATIVSQSPVFDIFKDSPPVSISQAAQWSIEVYSDYFGEEAWGIDSITLDNIPSREYRDRWFYKVNVRGSKYFAVAVLMDGSVFVSKVRE